MLQALAKDPVTSSGCSSLDRFLGLSGDTFSSPSSSKERLSLRDTESFGEKLGLQPWEERRRTFPLTSPRTDLKNLKKNPPSEQEYDH